MTGEDALLASEIERLVGGTVRTLERQARWRKAWFATVDRDGAEVPLYIRGDKQMDAEPFPGLDREAAILQIFERNGLPAAYVYGMSIDPFAIVMDSLPGSRDVTAGGPPDEQVRLAERYIELLAQSHAIDPAEFVAAGIHCPATPEAAVFAYLDAHIPLYRRTKRTPQPLLEWAIGLLRRHAPVSGGAARPVLGDPGQFLVVKGAVTGIYDFESTHLGDPVHDLAALRLRHGSEPLGAEPAHLIRHYAKITGVPVDSHALSFHTASFMLASVMSMAGPLSSMADDALQVEYLIWDLTCTRALMWAIAELLGERITPAAPLAGRSQGRSALVGRALQGTIARLRVGADGRGAMDATSAVHLAQWIEAAAGPAAAHEAADLDRAEAILGTRPADWRAADAVMERFVADAGPEQDLALFRYFAAQVEDRVSEAVPFQDRMAQYALDPVALQG